MNLRAKNVDIELITLLILNSSHAMPHEATLIDYSQSENTSDLTFIL